MFYALILWGAKHVRQTTMPVQAIALDTGVRADASTRGAGPKFARIQYYGRVSSTIS